MSELVILLILILIIMSVMVGMSRAMLHQKDATIRTLNKTISSHREADVNSKVALTKANASISKLEDDVADRDKTIRRLTEKLCIADPEFARQQKEKSNELMPWDDA